MSSSKTLCRTEVGGREGPALTHALEASCLTPEGQKPSQTGSAVSASLCASFASRQERSQRGAGAGGGGKPFLIQRPVLELWGPIDLGLNPTLSLACCVTLMCYFTSLSLRVFTCKTGIILLVSSDCYEQ